MVARTMDAALVNRIANDPRVRPFIGAPEAGPLDFGPVLGDVVALMDATGGFLCRPEPGGVFDIHALFLPEGRGAHALALARAGETVLFEQYGASALVARPKGNRGAVTLLTRLGFTPTDGGAWYLTRRDWSLTCQQPS